MVEVGLVDRGEGVAVGAVLLRAERDGRVAARAKVERLARVRAGLEARSAAAELGARGCGVAFGFCGVVSC